MQMAMGQLLEKRGELKEAMLAYQAAMKHHPSRFDCYLRLAILYDRQGQFVESQRLFQQAIEKSPGNPDVFCCVGYSYYIQGRWLEAETMLRQAIKINPGHRRAHNNLGLLMARRDHFESALAEFREAGNNEVDCRLNLALALSLQGRLSEARDQYQVALGFNPSSAEAKRGLRQVDAMMARIEKRLTQEATAFYQPQGRPQSTQAATRDHQLEHPSAQPAVQLVAMEEATEDTRFQFDTRQAGVVLLGGAHRPFRLHGVNDNVFPRSPSAKPALREFLSGNIESAPPGQFSPQHPPHGPSPGCRPCSLQATSASTQ